MLHVVEVDNLEQLARYRLLWRSLFGQMSRPSFFQSYQWLETYWWYFGDSQQLRVLVVYSGDEAVGILPLVVRTETTRLGSVRVLTYPLHDWGSCYGPIGPNPAATLYGAMRYLRDRQRDWDMLDLRWIDPAADRGRTANAMRMNAFAPVQQPWMQGAVIDTSEGWESYWAARSPKLRENLRRCRRKLERLGCLEYERYRPDVVADDVVAPRWDLFEACIEVAAQSRQAENDEHLVMSHPRIAEFLADVHEIAYREGCLDVNLLRLDGRPIAFAYNYCFAGEVFGLRTGFDRQLAAFGPGSVLRQMMVEDSFRRGDRRIDLGMGYLESKTPWQTQTVASYRCTHFAPTVRGRLLRVKRWADDRFGDQERILKRRGG